MTLTIAIACFPGHGGSGVVASELGLGLARRGHRVHILSSAPLSRPTAGCERMRFHEVAAPSYPPLEAGYPLALTSALIDLGQRESLDVIHSHYALPHAPAAWLASLALGSRAPARVVTLHGTDVTRLGDEPAYRAVTCASVAASHAISVPSQHLEHQARMILGLPSSREVTVIPNFVDAEHFVPASARRPELLRELLGSAGFDTDEPWGPVLMHASNLRQVKRPTDLVDVLAHVRQSVPARLVIVGDGPERHAVLDHARALGVERYVAMLGYRPDFIEYLQHADVFLSSSETESFGLAALEAMSCGVPVCGYRVGGLHEVVGDDAGTLVSPRDVRALGEAAQALLGDEPKRASMGTAARARAVSQFRLDPALDAYEALYRRAMDTAREEKA